MRLWRSSLGSSSPLTALGLTSLGYVQWELREYAGGQAELSRSRWRSAASPCLPDHPVIARSLNNLGIVQKELQEYAAAKQSHEQAAGDSP